MASTEGNMASTEGNMASTGGTGEGDTRADPGLLGLSDRAEPDVAAKESCIKYVDALWFCYSPVFQTTEYYRQGQFDSCLGKWGDMWDCVRLRTSAAPAILAKREVRRQEAEEQAQSAGPPIWELRTPEESSAFWKSQFGQSQDAKGRTGHA